MIAPNGAGSGGGVSPEQLVSVNLDDVRAAQQFAASDEFVVAALNKIESAVFQGGLTVSLETFQKPVELSDDHQALISHEWREAAALVNREMFIVGFCVVKPVPSRKLSREWELHVIPSTFYQLQMVESSRLPRHYFVTYNDATYPQASLDELLQRQYLAPSDDNGNGEDMITKQNGDNQAAMAPPPPKRSKTLPRPSSAATTAAATPLYRTNVIRLQANENNLGYPLVDGSRSHMIFVRYPPTPDGRLQSPVALLRRSMTSFRHMVDDEYYAHYWRTHPLHVIKITKNIAGAGAGGGGGAGGNVTGRETFGVGLFGNGDVENNQEAWRYQRNESEYLDWQLAQRAASEGRQLTARDKETARQSALAAQSATHEISPQNPNSLVAPSDAHNIVLGVNQDMAQGPKPEGHPSLDKIRDIVMDLAFSMLNIMPQVVNPQRTKQAGSDPQTVLREWDSALQNIQQWLRPVLEECYRVAYSQYDTVFVNDFYRAFKVESDRLEQEALENAKKQPSYNPQSTGGLLTRTQFEEIASRNGQTDVVRSLRKERKRTVRQMISNGLRVTFSFNHTPINTLQNLRALYDWFVINEDTFVRMAGSLNGISKDDLLLDEKAREAERKKRTDQNNKNMEAELALRSKYEVAGKKSTGKVGGGGGGGGGGGFGGGNKGASSGPK
jgi:hypothetical protein